MISRNEGLKVVVNALFASIPAMANVLMVGLLFLLIFAIMGVNFFKGEFYQCNGISVDVKTKDACLTAGGTWENAQSNFDNVWEAMLTLFEMMSTEGWLGVMFMGMDSVGVDK